MHMNNGSSKLSVEQRTNNFVENLKNTSIWYEDFYYENLRIQSSRDLIDITCSTHGEITIPREHMFRKTKHPCPHCKSTKKRNSTLSSKDFYEQLLEKHKDRFDISKTKFEYICKQVVVTCREHGDFDIYPRALLSNKRTCPHCKLENYSHRVTFSEFKQRSIAIHEDAYDYSEAEKQYVNVFEKITVICKTHGKFDVIPYSHYRGTRCAACANGKSLAEIQVKDFVETLTEISTKRILHPLELDIYVEKHKLAIEYNGLYWHSSEWKDSSYHLRKTKLCNEQDVQLIHIFEDEWLNKREIVESRIANILGHTEKRIYARKCIIKEVNSSESSRFLEQNHIQGNASSSRRLGLFFEDEIVALMTFSSLRIVNGSKHKEHTYELIRFCNKINTTIVGGASKLLTNFIRTTKDVESIISYSDKRWSTGNLYKSLNFDYVSTSEPSYAYIVNGKREHRFKYRKSELIKQGHSENLSESQIMQNRGIHRIYDCGTDKWVLNFK